MCPQHVHSLCRSEGQTPVPAAALQVLDVVIKHALATRKDVITSPGGFFFEQFKEQPAHGRSKGASYEACAPQHDHTVLYPDAVSGLAQSWSANDFSIISILSCCACWRQSRVHKLIRPAHKQDSCLTNFVASMYAMMPQPCKWAVLC